ncbi:MAG: CHAD domain-containing protein [Chloroflexi bacterium]|nr:CHAD domain-containing protein [Chloroflexota bacterium]
MSANELLLTALDLRFENYRAEHKRCKAEFSEEAVHDLRVSTRRLLAMVELLRTLAPDQGLQKLRRSLKAQLDSLDDLRDTQVMLVETSDALENLAELAPFLKFLQKRENRYLKNAEIEVGQFKLNGISRRVSAIRNSLTKPALSEDLLAQILAGVDDVYQTVIRRTERVDSSQSASIHQVRVVFKKFRYMVEIIFPILPGFPVSGFKRMHAYQAAMGEIQDDEVLLNALDSFASRHKAYDPKPARRFYEQHHAELINAYIDDMNEIFTFWREGPGKPFPWESREKDEL